MAKTFTTLVCNAEAPGWIHGPGEVFVWPIFISLLSLGVITMLLLSMYVYCARNTKVPQTLRSETIQNSLFSILSIFLNLYLNWCAEKEPLLIVEFLYAQRPPVSVSLPYLFLQHTSIVVSEHNGNQSIKRRRACVITGTRDFRCNLSRMKMMFTWR